VGSERCIRDRKVIGLVSGSGLASARK